MAISKGIFKMSGAFGTASCYSLPGSDQMIIRTKGGPSARRMKIGPEFEVVRKHQKEWRACVMFSQSLKFAFGDVYRLADYNVSPVWNGLGKNIVKADSVGLLGERNLKVSEYKSELQGFSLNRNFQLNALLGVQPLLALDTEKLVASAKFPPINSTRDVFNVRKLPYFRLKISFGLLSDILFIPDERGGCYQPEHEWGNGVSMTSTSEWFSTNDKLPELELSTQFEEYFTDNNTDKTNMSYLLSMGLEFGNVGFGGNIEPVKLAGAGKCMLVK